MLKEFQEFAIKGNALDMAVGIIIGAAFGTVVQSLVADIMTPPLGLLLGGVEFSDLFLTLSEGAEPGPYATLEAARQAGAVTVNYGVFLNAVMSLLLVALAIFLVVRSFNRLRRGIDRQAVSHDGAAPAEGEPAPEGEAEPEAAIAEPTAEVKLLREIRDLLEAGAAEAGS